MSKKEIKANISKAQNGNGIKLNIDENAISSATSSLKAMQDALKPTEEIRARMKTLSDALGENSAMSKVAKQIADHQKTLDAFKPFRDRILDPIMDNPDLHSFNSARQIHDVTKQLQSIKNPIVETNERLASIEDRFGEIYEVATEAAQIANGLNAAAAEFLVKFEQAALSNEKSARKAILIGAAAIMIAVLMPVFQIIYNEFWSGPRESAATQIIISDLKSEILELQQQQNENLQDLVAALEKSDDLTLDVMRDMKGMLLKQSIKENTAPNIVKE